jgi:hypothetical protein
MNRNPALPRLAAPLLACTLALANAPANAQAGATPATPDNGSACFFRVALKSHIAKKQFTIVTVTSLFDNILAPESLRR